MIVSNWQHHSKKDQKRKLKPQKLRQRKESLKFLKLKLKLSSKY